MPDPIVWQPVQAYLYRLLAGRTTHITAGTEAWVELPDDDPAKWIAVLTAGSRWCLQEQLDQIDAFRAAAKEAAIDIAEARDWAAVAKRVRDRDAAHRTGAHVSRKVS